MDPDATLFVIRHLMPAALDGDTDAAEQIAELVDALDIWISRGGFLPAVWARPTEVGR